MRKLGNPVRGYGWGSRTVLADLLGRPVPSPGPEAELWIGAHPGGPSTVAGTPLTELIAAAPEEVLGEAVVARYGARLPYLLKVLAAAEPLSLQAHPDPAQAAAGYEAEEAEGVPVGAPHRRYRDPYHKPELLVALTGFRALCGFREPGESATLLGGLGMAAELAPVIAKLAGGDLAGAVRWLLEYPEPAGLVAGVAANGGLAAELHAAYPGDAGVMVALLLNEVTLEPGEAIFMPAGNLHAYLHGAGVEIMAASDNVLRGGLTPKHVDVAELLRVLRFEPLAEPVRAPVEVAPGVVTWPVPVTDFTLHRVRSDAGAPVAELAVTGPRVVLCVAGEVRVDDGVIPVTLSRGEAALGYGSAAGALALACTESAGPTDAFVASVGS
jgi:mannose-6-phosphate isomerase